MSSLLTAAKRAGLHPARCENCHRKINTKAAVKELFNTIIQMCADGEVVRIDNFGVFRLRLHQGRTIESSVLPGGRAEFEDRMVLSFRQSVGVKNRLSKIIKANNNKKERKGKK